MTNRISRKDGPTRNRPGFDVAAERRPNVARGGASAASETPGKVRAENREAPSGATDASVAPNGASRQKMNGGGFQGLRVSLHPLATIGRPSGASQSGPTVGHPTGAASSGDPSSSAFDNSSTIAIATPAAKTVSSLGVPRPDVGAENKPSGPDPDHAGVGKRTLPPPVPHSNRHAT